MQQSIDGTLLYNSLQAGYHNFLRERRNIDAINLFPVPDGDTGSNIAHTLASVFQKVPSHPSVSTVMHRIAEQALFNARGNSGMILAQFFKGFHLAVHSSDRISREMLVSAIQSGTKQAFKAVDTPVEGTILTVMRKLSFELNHSMESILTIPLLLHRGLRAAERAERETTDEMPVLKKAGVVDAGAKAFVALLQGVTAFIRSGEIPESASLPKHDLPLPVHDHSAAEEPKGGRFCTEAIIRNVTAGVENIRERLHGKGDSLVIGEFDGNVRVHQHTDNPAGLFDAIAPFGTVDEKKVDDIHRQYLTVHRPLSKTVIVTDSSADIPEAMLDELRIQTIAQQILFSDETHLDRLTIDNPILVKRIAEKDEFPTSSMASVGSMQTLFSYLSEYYESIIVISIAAELSGTFQSYRLAAEGLLEQEYPIHIIDSRKNATAQGLLTLMAARMAADNVPASEIVSIIEQERDRTEILVSVQNIEHMIRSGRISGRLGTIARKLHMHPIIGLTKGGGGTIKGVKFSKVGSISSVIQRIKRAHHTSGITSFAVSYVRDRALAEQTAELIQAATGIAPEFIVPVSPVIAMFAGDGAVSVAYRTA